MTLILWDSVAVSQEGLSYEMHRCDGRRVYEKCYGPHEQFFAWRCIFCGEIVDGVMLENRFVPRVNRGFDLMLDFQKNLNDDQKKNGIG
jgi:hypothetical protein